MCCATHCYSVLKWGVHWHIGVLNLSTCTNTLKVCCCNTLFLINIVSSPQLCINYLHFSVLTLSCMRMRKCKRLNFKPITIGHTHHSRQTAAVLSVYCLCDIFAPLERWYYWTTETGMRLPHLSLCERLGGPLRMACMVCKCEVLCTRNASPWPPCLAHGPTVLTSPECWECCASFMPFR